MTATSANGGARIGEPDAGIQLAQFDPLLDAKAASQLLGVPPTWLLAQARARRVPHVKLGHYVRFSARDLQLWLEESKIPATQD